MSVEHFLGELERRGLLAERLIEVLRAKVAESDKPFTAKSLAQFLVQKAHLSPTQATELLGNLTSGGDDIEPAVSEDPTQISPPDEIIPLISPVSAVDLGSNQIPQLPADLAETDYEGSSIFEPFPLPSHRQPRNNEPEEEITLAPDSELDALEADRPMAPSRPTVVEEEVEVPSELPQLSSLLSASAPTKSARISEPTPELPSGLDESPIASDLGEVQPAVKRPKKRKPAKRSKAWDSPLILLGGGGLALLLLAGGTIWWLLKWESGDQQLQQARAALKGGAYPQAVERFEEFLKGSPRHPERSLARVQLAMVKIRQATESAQYPAALEQAEKELPAIEDEEDFDESHGESAALLPQIALGLAQQAEQSDATSDDAVELVELANKALALCNNANFLPKSLRDEGKLATVRETLQRVERRQQTHRALDAGLQAMLGSLDDGNTSAAYIAYAKLLEEHPELADDASLAEMLKKTTAAEQAAVKFVAEQQPAKTTEHPTPWLASLALANRRVKPAAAAPSPDSAAPVCLRVEGAIYGLDAATGRLLWRRHVGYADATWPIPAGAHVLVSDSQRRELLRLEASTGQLVWRQSIGEEFAQPLVVGERAFLASRSGRLYVIDLNTGDRLGYVAFAQPLLATPSVDRKGERLYLAGEHSSLYTISLADLSCLGAYYLGHAAGSVTVSPVPISNKLAVLENFGVETSRLRLMSLESDGTVAGEVLEQRLTGLATSPPFVSGRRLIAITDRGQIDAYEVSPGNGKDALTLVARRAAPGSKPVVRHAALVGNYIWVGDTQLTRYSILPTGNRLPVEPIESNFAGAAFDHPLSLVGTMLIHASRPKSRAGVVVAATDTERGKIIWETDLALPPAGPPVVDDANKALAMATADGSIFRFDEAAIRARVKDESLVPQSAPAGPTPISFVVDLGQGRAAFGSPGSDQLLLYNSAPGGALARWIKLESPIACAASRFGDGLIAPLEIGQVFYLSSADGAALAAPFQPLLQPGSTWKYQPAVPTEEERQFVIADGRGQIYLIALVEQPPAHLQLAAEAKVPYPIESPMTVLGDSAIAVMGSSHLARYSLPSLESDGNADLPAPVVAGPFLVGNTILLVTANEQLSAVDGGGEVAWQVAIEHGDLAGAPLLMDDSVLFAYRNGVLERRSLEDGSLQSTIDVAHPLAAGPVRFLQRLVLAANDGALIVLDPL